MRKKSSKLQKIECSRYTRQKTTNNVNNRIWIVLILSFFLVACQEQGTPTLYIPPTRDTISASSVQNDPTEASITPIQTQPVRPTPSPICSAGLAFLEDITIPDGTVVSPGEVLDKRWLVENNGSCNWNAGFGLQLIAGPEMGAHSEQALFPARSGSQAEIAIVFTAPVEPGSYRSAWQAQDAQGVLFGDPIFIEIVVTNQ